jgi:hypothetical protein
MLQTLRRIRKAIWAGLVGEGGVFAALGFEVNNPAWWIAAIVVPFFTAFIAYWIPNEPGSLTNGTSP